MHRAINNERINIRCKYEAKTLPTSETLKRVHIAAKKTGFDHDKFLLNPFKDATLGNYSMETAIHATEFYNNLKAKKPLIKSLGDVPILSERNGKLVPNPELGNRFAQLFTEMQYYGVQNDKPFADNEKEPKNNDTKIPKTVKVRGSSDALANMFRPAHKNYKKFGESFRFTIPQRTEDTNGPSKSMMNGHSQPLWLHGRRTQLSYPEDRSVHYPSTSRYPLPGNSTVQQQLKNETRQTSTAKSTYKHSYPYQRTRNSSNLLKLLPRNDVPNYITTSTHPTTKYVPWYYKTQTLHPSYEGPTEPVFKNVSERFSEYQGSATAAVALPSFSTGNSTLYIHKISNNTVTSAIQLGATQFRATDLETLSTAVPTQVPNPDQTRRVFPVSVESTLPDTDIRTKFEQELMPKQQKQQIYKVSPSVYSKNFVTSQTKILISTMAPTVISDPNSPPSSIANFVESLKTQTEQVDLTHLRKAADNYLTSALKKLQDNAHQFQASLAERNRNAALNDSSVSPWSQLISIVAPAVEKVSPTVFQRIKQGISQWADVDVPETKTITRTTIIAKPS